MTGLLGAKQSDMQELTPLADLVVPPECKELVSTRVWLVLVKVAKLCVFFFWQRGV